MGSVAREAVRSSRRDLVVAGPGRWQWFDPYAGEREEATDADEPTEQPTAPSTR